MALVSDDEITAALEAVDAVSEKLLQRDTQQTRDHKEKLGLPDRPSPLQRFLDERGKKV